MESEPNLEACVPTPLFSIDALRLSLLIIKSPCIALDDKYKASSLQEHPLEGTTSGRNSLCRGENPHPCRTTHVNYVGSCQSISFFWQRGTLYLLHPIILAA